MAELSTPYGDYVPTEADLFKMVGNSWPEKLRKDYIAGKFTATQLLQFINNNQAAIEDLEVRVTAIDGEIVTIKIDITSIKADIVTIEGDITTLQSDVAVVADGLADHVAADVAHGSSGNIVGTDDYCSSTVGGTVLLADAVANATTSSVTPPGDLPLAGATYSQAYAQEQSDAINELINNISDLKATLNAAIAALNNSLSSERTAKQRAL